MQKWLNGISFDYQSQSSKGLRTNARGIISLTTELTFSLSGKQNPRQFDNKYPTFTRILKTNKQTSTLKMMHSANLFYYQ